MLTSDCHEPYKVTSPPVNGEDATIGVRLGVIAGNVEDGCLIADTFELCQFPILLKSAETRTRAADTSGQRYPNVRTSG